MTKDYSELVQLPLKDLNVLLRRLENELKYWNNEKAIIYESTLSAVNFSKEKIMGGKKPDDKVKIDRIIDNIQPKIEYINELIIDIRRIIFTKEEKLKEDKKYAELIVYYRDEKLIEDSKTKRLRHLHWQEIASILRYNKDHCRRIYRNYKKR